MFSWAYASASCKLAPSNERYHIAQPWPGVTVPHRKQPWCREHWEPLLAMSTIVETPDSLLRSLEHLTPPTTWLARTPRAASLIAGAADLTPVPCFEWIELAAGESVRLVDLAEQPGAAVRLRIVPSILDPGMSAQVLTVTRDSGATETVAMSATRDGHVIAVSGQPPIPVDALGWIDVVFGAAATQLHHRNREVATLAPATRDPLTFAVPLHANNGANSASARVHLDLTTGESGPGAESLVHLAAVIDRLDQSVPQWRSPNGADPSARPSTIWAARSTSESPRLLPSGSLDLLGFLSDGWQRRIEVESWSYRLGDGSPVDPASLDAYGRAGGLICYAYDRSWSFASIADETTPVDAGPCGPVVYDGPRCDWVAGVRSMESLLRQLGTAAYFATQTNSSDVDHPQPTRHLLDAIDQLWHPTYAFHIDVVAIAALSIGRYRFSDPNWLLKAPAVLGQIRDDLATMGVGARPVVLS